MRFFEELFKNSILPRKPGTNIAMKINKWSTRAIP